MNYIELQQLQNLLGPQQRRVTVNPTVDTAAHAAGDLISPKMTFEGLLSGLGRGSIVGAVLEDRANQAAAITIVLFGSDPSNTTFTKNAAFDVADVDLSKVVGTLRLRAGSGSSGDYEQFNDNAVATLADFRLPIEAASEDVYVAMVSRGTPTYAASDLTLSLIAE